MAIHFVTSPAGATELVIRSLSITQESKELSNLFHIHDKFLALFGICNIAEGISRRHSSIGIFVITVTLTFQTVPPIGDDFPNSLLSLTVSREASSRPSSSAFAVFKESASEDGGTSLSETVTI